MYCSFYGFKEKPFTLTPNPRFIFLGKNHREAFAHLLYGIDNRAGFIAFTGEVGTGKTTVLRTLLGQLDESGHRTALIFNPCLSVPELLASINLEFGIPCNGLSVSEMVDLLNHFLLWENSAGRTVTLIIDEAQNLDPQLLEHIRLISNLETKTDKLIQIILAGQPELETLLEKPELRQLDQRITVRYHLRSLDFDDTKAYINHRLEKAGELRPAIFTTSALKRIFRATGGLPRLINIICDRCLLIGYTEETREITGRIAAQAIREILVKRRLMRQGRRLWFAAAFLIALLAAMGMFFGLRATTDKPSLPVHRSVPPVPSPAITITALPPKPVAAVDDFIAAVRWEMNANSEGASAVRAINVLAELWRFPALPADRKMAHPGSLEQLAGQRGLRLTPVTGDLATLFRIGVPTLLEFTLPDLKGKRYIVLTGRKSGQLFVTPSLLGKSSLSEAELKSLWSGRSYLAWKDFNRIAPLSKPDAKGVGVLRLQKMLADTGIYALEPSGVYDEGTMNAVREFQKRRGIAQSGLADGITLLLLYRDAGKFTIPRLTDKGRGRKQ
ncbi:MAG: AAA family ATPase [Geobacteraceae bacterium]